MEKAVVVHSLASTDVPSLITMTLEMGFNEKKPTSQFNYLREVKNHLYGVPQGNRLGCMYTQQRRQPIHVN